MKWKTAEIWNQPPRILIYNVYYFRGTLAQNLYFESFALTSATFAVAMSNLNPAITFILAISVGYSSSFLTCLAYTYTYCIHHLHLFLSEKIFTKFLNRYWPFLKFPKIWSSPICVNRFAKNLNLTLIYDTWLITLRLKQNVIF